MLHIALVLVNLTELDKALACIQRHASEGGVEYRRRRAAGLQGLLHQLATDTLTLIVVAHDDQADGGVVALLAGEARSDQAPGIFHNKSFSDALQHGPVVQAVRPFELH
ncbi:hypothetical protein D3C76_1454150 [compost metagenome]